MSIADKLILITENLQKIFDKGYDKGWNKGYSQGWDEASGFTGGEFLIWDCPHCNSSFEAEDTGGPIFCPNCDNDIFQSPETIE